MLLPGALPALGQLGTQLPRGIAEDLRMLLRQPIALRTVLVLLIGGVASGFILHQETTRLHAQEVAKVIAATSSLAQRQSGQSPTAPAPIQRIDLSCPTAPSFGPEKAPITLVEVSGLRVSFLSARRRYHRGAASRLSGQAAPGLPSLSAGPGL